MDKGHQRPLDVLFLRKQLRVLNVSMVLSIKCVYVEPAPPLIERIVRLRPLNWFGHDNSTPSTAPCWPDPFTNCCHFDPSRVLRSARQLYLLRKRLIGSSLVLGAALSRSLARPSVWLPSAAQRGLRQLHPRQAR